MKRTNRSKPNNRKLVPDSHPGGIWKLRISQRKGAKSRFARTLIRCGCCDESVEIHYDDETIEINGVIASTREWMRVLGPILRGKTP